MQTIAVTVGSDRTDRQRVCRHNMRGLRDWGTRARPVDSAKRWHLQLQRGTQATDVTAQLLARKPTAPSRSEWFYRSRAGRLERRRCRLVRQNRSRLRIQAILGVSCVPSSVLASKSVDGSDLLTLDVEGRDFSADQRPEALRRRCGRFAEARANERQARRRVRFRRRAAPLARGVSGERAGAVCATGAAAAEHADRPLHDQSRRATGRRGRSSSERVASGDRAGCCKDKTTGL